MYIFHDTNFQLLHFVCIIYSIYFAAEIAVFKLIRLPVEITTLYFPTDERYGKRYDTVGRFYYYYYLHYHRL